jgi:hypothetical protein
MKGHRVKATLGKVNIVMPDISRDELMKRANQFLKEFPDSEVFFKFTCRKCGERCSFSEPNILYENGECFKCGFVTTITEGGFMVSMSLKPRAKQHEANKQI